MNNLMTKSNNVQLTNSVSATLGTTYKLRLDGTIVYISFRQSKRYIIADVQVGNNHKTFSYFDNRPLLEQVSPRCVCNKVEISNVIDLLVSKLEASS